MLIIPRKLKAFSGVVTGETATLDIKGGATLHEIHLETSLTAAQMTLVTVNLNGDPIYSLTGADLVMLERYRKRYETSGLFVINFSDIVNASMESRNISALVTFPTDNISVEVKIASGIVGTITLKASAEVSASQAERKFIPRKYRTSLKPGQTTENTWDSLTQGPAVQRIHFYGDLTRVKWVKDNLTVWEREDDRNAAQLKRMDRAPQAGYFHFDAIESDFGIADLFQTIVAETLVCEYDLTTVQTVPVIVEAIQRVAPINAQVQ